MAACSGRGADAPKVDPTSAGQCLSIVAWNDVHGQLGPDDPVVDTGRIKAGGVVALADEVAAIRATGDATIVLDAGDLFTGPMESTLAEGRPIVEAFRVIGVDAAAVGNHEFDFGPVGYEASRAAAGIGDEAGERGPRGALLAAMAASPFPYLSANLERSNGQPIAWKNFADRATISRGDYRVGVVGYTTVETPTTTLFPNVEDLEFASHAAPRVAASIRALRAEHASPVVLLSHASLEGELPGKLDDPADPRGEKRVGELARLLDALGPDKPDLIAAGHRHAWMLGQLRGIPIVSSSQHGVGLTRIRYCGSRQSPALEQIERRVAIAHDPPRTALGRKVQATVQPWIDRVHEQAQEVVTTLARTCVPQATTETAYAEQVARSVLAKAGEAKAPPPGVPVIAFVNAGGLRAPLLAGVIRFADLFAAFPFENSVAICQTDGAGVRRVIENATHRPSVRERFPFGIAGAHVSLRRRADGQLDYLDLRVDGASGNMKDSDIIFLAIPDFLLWGGDGFLKGVSCTSKHESSTRIRDAWRSVLAAEKGGCDGYGSNVRIE